MPYIIRVPWISHQYGLVCIYKPTNKFFSYKLESKRIFGTLRLIMSNGTIDVELDCWPETTDFNLTTLKIALVLVG